MDVAQTLLRNMQTDVLKEPRGFMKILQILFTLCGFATTTSFATSLVLSAVCPKGASPNSVTVPIEYNFKLYEIDSLKLCNETLHLRQDFSSDSGFFVAVGVIAFLFAIAVLIAYCIYAPMYEQNPLLPLADCVVHGIFTVLYLASSSAWANSLSSLKTSTDLATIKEELPLCSSTTCTYDSFPNYSKLNISIIFGFLNMFLFGSNIWFLYKETTIFKEKQAQEQQQQQPPMQQPPI